MVAIDVTPFVGVRTGIGHAVVETLEALRRSPQAPGLVPYAIGTSAFAARGSLPLGTRVVPVPTTALLRAWSSLEAPRFDRLLRPANVLHATNFIAPPTRLPTIVTVHDCAFVRFPELVPASVRPFRAVVGRAVARGALVHCTTEAVATEVDELFGPSLREGGRLVVVPYGVPRLGDSGPLPVGVAGALGGRPYVLALGALEPRKNLPRLVRAFEATAPRHGELRLVLAGPDGPDRPAIDAAIDSLDPPMRERVILAGAMNGGARRHLIEGAAVLAYPSLYEGFGFPMLEAMSLGVPVVAGRSGGLPEVAGEAALLVDPTDTTAIGDGLERVLSDSSVRERLVAAGRERAAAFSWEAAAEGLIAAYRRLLGEEATTSS